MISCPACEHTEYEGTLFCSECGSRLWGEGDPTETMALLSGDLAVTGFGSTVGFTRPTGVKPNQINVRIRGVANAIVLAGKDEYYLGRADDGSGGYQSDLDLTDYKGIEKGVSRQHLILRQDDEGVVAIDQGSTNGTLVNGQRLIPHQALRLTSGDELRLGKLALRVYFER